MVKLKEKKNQNGKETSLAIGFNDREFSLIIYLSLINIELFQFYDLNSKFRRLTCLTRVIFIIIFLNE